MYTRDIFSLADLCIEAGWLPGLKDLRYVVLLVWPDGARAEVHRSEVEALIPSPARAWCIKGATVHLLGDTAALPADLSAGVGPPFLG